MSGLEAMISFRGVLLFSEEADTLVVQFPQTIGPLGGCRHRGRHHPIAALFDVDLNDGVGEPRRKLLKRYPIRGKKLSASSKRMISVGGLPAELFDLARVVGGFGKRTKPRIDRDCVTTVTLRRGKVSGRTQSETIFELFDLAGQSSQKFKPYHEIVWSGLSGETITVSGLKNKQITVAPGQDLVIGHFDKRTDAKTYQIGLRDCRARGSTPLKDVDFAWLYRLVGVDIDRGTLPTVVSSKNPFTSTCFGGHFP